MKNSALKIRILGDAALRRRSETVKGASDHHRAILREMAQLMYANAGIGLAAPQVGINERMIVVDVGSGLYKLINPRIIKREGSRVMQEGCLSVPDVCIKVKRARKVVVRAEDENGQPLNIEAQDLLACVLQHEIDHLDGKLIIDYASLFERIKIQRKVSRVKKDTHDEELYKSEAKSCKLQL
jgi:peptide deformylase